MIRQSHGRQDALPERAYLPMVPQPATIGSASFDPDQFFERWASGEISAPQDTDLRSATIKAFSLKTNDDYVYHATASVTLAQVQAAINHGDKSGLLAWYLDKENGPARSTTHNIALHTNSQTQLPNPPLPDIDAYTTIFLPSTSTPKSLTAFASNAKKLSLRAAVATNLTSHRLVPTSLTIPVLKKQPHVNPYLDVWIWSCRALQYCGPDAHAARLRHSHAVLPVFYHHYGCVCPSFEALEAIRQLARGRGVVEVGSGNGYWAYMLRRLGVSVAAVDNGDSVWRTMWIGDTVKQDGAKYLAAKQGAEGEVLLMVYPQVSTHFTRSVLEAYKGGLVVVAGTQNRNGFTAFRDEVVDEYVAREMPQFEKILQTPLPSFAGKDEALFIFQRKS